MSAVEVTISGVLWDKTLKAGRPVTLIGEAIITGLGVGGGPMPPGEGGQPPSIWPSPGHPAHPIAPGGPPPTIWPDPRPPAGVWPDPNPPHPAHPIVTPPPGSPDQPPPDPIEPPIEWKAVWHPTEGWVLVGIPNFEHPTPSE